MILVVGIDPASGASSPVGIAIFEPTERIILYTEEIQPKRRLVEHRLREINHRLAELLESIDPEAEVLAFIESTYIKGRGNQVFQQAVGAIKAAIPFECSLEEVPNTTVKKIAGGSGKADKTVLANAMAIWFNNEEIRNMSFDVTDALAIGVSGWLRREGLKI